jgi:hypothetical protein
VDVALDQWSFTDIDERMDLAGLDDEDVTPDRPDGPPR